MAKMTMKAEISFWASKSVKLEDKCRLLETENADLRAESPALREQLAELKALPPVAWTDAEELRFPYATSDMWPKPLEFGRDIPLFTAARPSELESVK
ncbi:TPA: hypothetical protein R1156_003036 [Yersinia enterocolitica]|nr:hypothetical protein [Yersinia enterocolitica]HEI6964562.1 hypothetical protein [Yersinia enterocolitica]